MPVSTSLADGITRKLPSVIAPKHRERVDYAIAGSFLAAATVFGRSKKRSALGCLVCGAAELLLTRLTDYSGRGKRPVSMHARRQMDLGFATLLAVLPQVLESRDSGERGFFLAEAAILTAVSNLTKPTRGEKESTHQAA